MRGNRAKCPKCGNNKAIEKHGVIICARCRFSGSLNYGGFRRR